MKARGKNFITTFILCYCCHVVSQFKYKLLCLHNELHHVYMTAMWGSVKEMEERKSMIVPCGGSLVAKGDSQRLLVAMVKL